MSTPAPERRSTTTVATIGAVVVVVLVVVALNLLGRGDGATDAAPSATGGSGDPSAAASASAYADVVGGAPDDLARDELSARGAPAPQPQSGGSKDLAGAAEDIARQQRSYSFTLTTFNLLGSQHTAPGGDARGYASGVTRTGWASDLLSSYGASVVGLQEIQGDQLAALSARRGAAAAFWPGASLGPAGIPQNLMWDTSIWRSTFTGQVTIPFVGTLRPQPIVRLQHVETGREIYVMNVHNSPNGRQSERDQALAIEIAAVAELRKDGLPVFVVGDFNERDRAFCAVTGGTDLLAANGGANAGSCRPPGDMRIDWIFGSPDAQLSAYRVDQSPAVRRITDHAVITTDVTVS